VYVQRASTKNLHFDRDIPFSKLGSARVSRAKFEAMSNYSYYLTAANMFDCSLANGAAGEASDIDGQAERPQ
jgi:hypothetical protein